MPQELGLFARVLVRIYYKTLASVHDFVIIALFASLKFSKIFLFNQQFIDK